MSHWSRPVSSIERAWIAVAHVHPPFVNQAVLEGTGRPEVAAWEDALERAADADPGARAVLRGFACWMRWDALGPVRVREVDGSGWSGLDPIGAPFLREPLNLATGPTTEILVVRGDRDRLVLRTAHATTDGGGTLALLNDLFRVRRGEDPLGYVDRCTDFDLADAVPPERAPAPEALPPMGPPRGGPGEVTWLRVPLPEAPRPFLGRVVAGLARHARENADGDGPVRIDLPVDLRRAHPEVRSTGNLTGMLSVDVDVDPDAIASAVREAVARGRHHARIRGAAILRHLPQGLVDAGARRAAQTHATRRRFGSTAVVSNLGRLDVSGLHGPDFETTRVWFVPPGTPVTPLFMALSGGEAGSDLVLASPTHFGDAERLRALADAIVRALGATP